MNILFCTSSFITGKGGIASYAHDFVEAFQDNNTFTIVTNDNYQKQQDDDFEIVHFNMNDLNVSNALKFISLIKKCNPQIIINSASPLLALVSPYLNDSIKIISIAHFVDGKLLRTAGLNANYIDSAIVLSTFAKKNLDNWFHVNDKNKSKIIYNFMPTISNPNIEQKKGAKILRIVYPGGHSISKSADIVCMVLKKLLRTKLQFEFYWIGGITLPGANWPLAKTRNVSDCVNKYDSRIKAFGPVPRNISQDIISKANIFLLPSRGEGCPITLLEAMRGGCIPIISNAKHGSLDLIDNEKNGFVVKQNSANEIFKLIQDIIKKHEHYTYIYDASYRKFTNDLQYDVWSKKMHEIINAPIQHLQRIKFNRWKYFKDAKYIMFHDFLFWLKDRLIIQPYTIFIFRFIRYIY